MVGGGADFLIKRWETEEWFWQFEPSSKLKTLAIWTFFKTEKTFSKYWTLIKIKTSMNDEDYEVRIKIVQAHWLQLKMKFLLGYNMNIVF